MDAGNNLHVSARARNREIIIRLTNTYDGIRRDIMYIAAADSLGTPVAIALPLMRVLEFPR